MTESWNVGDFLRKLDRECGAVTINAVRPVEANVYECRVRTGFLEDELEVEEVEISMTLMWDPEHDYLSLTLGVQTLLPPKAYGWAMDLLNGMSTQQGCAAVIRVRAPKPEDDQRLIFIGSWGIAVPVEVQATRPGRQMMACLIQRAISNLCIETLLIQNQTEAEYFSNRVLM